MSGEAGYARPGIAGSGTVACQLAAVASAIGEVRLLARSDESARRAEERAQAACKKLEEAPKERVKVTTEPAELADCDLVVEAIREDLDLKADFIARLAGEASEADLASTTSSLSVVELGERCGHPERLFGLHVFNPVTQMDLVELCIPEASREGLRDRARQWCEALGKTPIEVPDQPGFVVNRLLFPFLFDAVRLMERTGMAAPEVDTCMKLGAGHPMGPLRLLDFVGLDVAEAIGDQLYADSGDDAHRPPGLLVEMVGQRRLGRKSGAGFYDYE